MDLFNAEQARRNAPASPAAIPARAVTIGPSDPGDARQVLEVVVDVMRRRAEAMLQREMRQWNPDDRLTITITDGARLFAENPDLLAQVEHVATAGRRCAVLLIVENQPTESQLRAALEEVGAGNARLVQAAGLPEPIRRAVGTGAVEVRLAPRP